MHSSSQALCAYQFQSGGATAERRRSGFVLTVLPRNWMVPLSSLEQRPGALRRNQNSRCVHNSIGWLEQELLIHKVRWRTNLKSGLRSGLMMRFPAQPIVPTSGFELLDSASAFLPPSPRFGMNSPFLTSGEDLSSDRAFEMRLPFFAALEYRLKSKNGATYKEVHASAIFCLRKIMKISEFNPWIEFLRMKPTIHQRGLPTFTR